MKGLLSKGFQLSGILPFAFLLALSLGLAFTTLSASAISDGVLRKTTTLPVGSNDIYYGSYHTFDCPNVEYAYDWQFSAVITANGVPQNLVSSLANGMNNGSYSVSSFNEEWDSVNSIYRVRSFSVTWVETGQLKAIHDDPATNGIKLVGDTGQTVNNVLMRSNGYQTYNPTPGDCRPVYAGSMSTMMSSNDATIKHLYASNMDFNPPVGYTGQTPNTTQPTEQITWRPQYKYCIENRQLKITDQSTLPPGDSDYHLKVISTQGTFETQTYFYEQTIAAGETATIPLNGSDPLAVQVFFANADGSIKADTSSINYLETDVTVSDTLVDKCGTTVGAPCDANDLCNPAVEQDKYIDCTQYNFLIKFWDSGVEWSLPSPATLGCAVNQAWMRILDTIAFVFDTSNDPMNWGPFQSIADSNNHGLASIITAPLGIFTSLSQQGYACATVTVPLPYMSNRSLQLPCMTAFYTGVGGAFFTMYQTIASGFIAYYVGVRLLEMVKGFKEPGDDKIEVSAL